MVSAAPEAALPELPLAAELLLVLLQPARPAAAAAIRRTAAPATGPITGVVNLIVPPRKLWGLVVQAGRLRARFWVRRPDAISSRQGRRPRRPPDCGSCRCHRS